MIGKGRKGHGADKKNKRPVFQTIARHFFRYRGAPFFLSSKDLDLIARWERMRVPLRTVLEGMQKAFEGPSRRRPKGKVFSLAFCQHHVQQAFELHKERKVGKASLLPEIQEKKRRAIAEIGRFLEALPAGKNSLRDLYARALVVLSDQNPDEEELEGMDQEVERLLIEESSDKEIDEVKKITRTEYDSMNQEEFVSVWKMKLVKLLRERDKIPYISLFYY